MFVPDLRRVIIQSHYINTQNFSAFVLNFRVLLLNTLIRETKFGKCECVVCVLHKSWCLVALATKL